MKTKILPYGMDHQGDVWTEANVDIPPRKVPIFDSSYGRKGERIGSAALTHGEDGVYADMEFKIKPPKVGYYALLGNIHSGKFQKLMCQAINIYDMPGGISQRVEI